MVNWTWAAQDIGGFFVAMFLHPFVVLLPGAAAARLLPSALVGKGQSFYAWSLLSGLALTPTYLDWFGRLGPTALVTADLALAAVGAVALWRRGSVVIDNWKWPTILFGATAIVALAGATSLPAAGDVWISLLSIDHVKHAAVADMIAQTGTPPRNLLAAPDYPPIRYYYYFYLQPAVIDLLGGAWVEPRHSVFASAPWLMLGLYALGLHIVRAAGPVWPDTNESRELRGKIVVSLLLVSGVATLLAAIRFNPYHDHLDLFLLGVLWTPQHNLSALAGMVGTVLLAWVLSGVEQPSSAGERRWSTFSAALAFTTCFASSVYVGLGIATACLAWLVVHVIRFDWNRAGAIIATGICSAILLAPFVLVLARAQADAQGPDPLVFQFRAPPYATIFGHELPAPIRTLIFYASSLGILGIGAAMYLRQARRDSLGNDMKLALMLVAGSCLIAGTILRSNIMSNDFGWRVLIPTQFVFLVWTAIIAHRLALAGATGKVLRFAMTLGRADMLASVISLFLVSPDRILEAHGEQISMSASAERELWDFMAARTEKNAVVQARPSATPHLPLEFYRNRPAVVTDQIHGVLYGVSPQRLHQLSQELSRAFTETGLSVRAWQDTMDSYGIDYLIIGAGDPVWSGAEWSAGRQPVFQNASYRVYPTKR